jgi:hypothetical protein
MSRKTSWILFLTLSPMTACGGRLVGWSTDTDTDPPTVTATTPDDEATGVALNASILATFSEAMDAATVTDAAWTMRTGGDPVAGHVVYVGNAAVFIPDQGLDPSARYTAEIAGDVADLAGNRMGERYIWTFTTSALLDETPPTVVSTRGEIAPGAAYCTDENSPSTL